MIVILQAVLVMLATVVSTLVEGIDLLPVPEDSEHMVTLEGSEPLPTPAARYGFEPITTQELPLGTAYCQPRTVYTDIRYVTKTEYITKTFTISPTEVPAERPNQTPDYCNSNGMFLYEPTNECFKYIKDEVRSFEDADAQCRKEGMRLAKPKNPKGIQKHLVTVLGTSGHVYIGARGDGQSFKWQRDGEKIMNTDSKWWEGMPAYYITTDRCLVLVASQNGVKKGTVYYPESCSVKSAALCQMEECSPQCAIGTCEGPHTCVYDPRSEEHLNMTDNEGNGDGDARDKFLTSDGFLKIPGTNKYYKGLTYEMMNWTNADARCKSLGLRLAKTTNPIELRKYLQETYGDKYWWLGARSDGTSYRWQLDGSVIKSSSAFWASGAPYIKHNHCLYMRAIKSEMDKEPSKPFRTCTCKEIRPVNPLCERG